MSKSSGKRTARGRLALRIVGTALGTLAVLLAATTVVATVVTTRFAAGQTIAPKVTLAGLPAEGLTGPEAVALLERSYVSRLPAQVEITWPGGHIAFERADLGWEPALQMAVDQALQVGRENGWWDRLVTHVRLRMQGVDVPVRMNVDEARVRLAVAFLAPRVNRVPQDAKVTVDGETLTKIPGKTGVKLLVEESVAALTKALQQGQAEKLALVVKEAPPNITEQDLADLQIVLSHFSTPYHTYQTDRTHNMVLAIGKINGTLLKPGQEFSVNQTVGERTVQDGYRAAPIFRDGKIVPDTGGGVCQVASTLYNAALLANLNVLQRDHHSRIVWYCPSGRDAAVYWGQKDLRFKNNLKHPLLLLGRIIGDRLHAWVVGHAEDDFAVELIRSKAYTTGYGTSKISDPKLEQGKTEVVQEGHGGGGATLTMKVSKEGKLLSSRVLHSDSYPAQSRVVRVGAKPKPPKPGTPGAVPPGTAPPAPGMTPSTPATRPAGPAPGLQPPAGNSGGVKPPAASTPAGGGEH